MTLWDYLRTICNWCNRSFDNEPVFDERDEQEVYAFCCEKCLVAMNELHEVYQRATSPEVEAAAQRIRDKLGITT